MTWRHWLLLCDCFLSISLFSKWERHCLPMKLYALVSLFQNIVAISQSNRSIVNIVVMYEADLTQKSVSNKYFFLVNVANPLDQLESDEKSEWEFLLKLVALPPQNKMPLREKYGKKERMRDWTTTERPKDRVGLQYSVDHQFSIKGSSEIKRSNRAVETHTQIFTTNTSL